MDPSDRRGVLRPLIEISLLEAVPGSNEADVGLIERSSRLPTEPGPVVPLKEPPRDDTDLGGGTSVRGTARLTSTCRTG